MRRWRPERGRAADLVSLAEQAQHKGGGSGCAWREDAAIALTPESLAHTLERGPLAPVGRGSDSLSDASFAASESSIEWNWR